MYVTIYSKGISKITDEVEKNRLLRMYFKSNMKLRKSQSETIPPVKWNIFLANVCPDFIEALQFYDVIHSCYV